MAGRRERKVVSVLFADLVGFTSRADTLDPEDVEAILSPYHAHLRAELERFGGSVEKFIGDAVVAVFGAPIAHEDDAERAVRAALSIRDWAREQEGLELRLAVNTGEALVSLDADPASGDHAVAGDVVNTASRLQAAAPINGILVGEATYRSTAQAIEYTAGEPVEAKGKAEPVPVWEPIQPRARLGSDVDLHTRSPLVGRERELDVLGGALARVREERSPQLVTLVGVPGIGKSRLVHELSRRVDDDPELITWRQGRCVAYGDGVSFWALAEMIKGHAGIHEDDSAAAAEEKVRTAVEEVVAETAEAEWVVTHLRPLLGLGEGGWASSDPRAESFAAWRRFFEALAEQRPLVLVFDDLHWADDGLLDFVDHLVDWAVGVPILLVATARPELLERRPGWGGGKANTVTLSLSPLSSTDTARLLHGLLDRAVLPAEIHALLLERAGGNPLYAEEFARIAGEREVSASDDLPVPESIQGLIAARLDALAPVEKSLLQDAAVVGKVFWLGSVGALGSDEPASELATRLHGLERKEFVRRERRTAITGDTQYVFGHGLVRDAAYGQIPRPARAEKHRLAAEWIEALGRAEDHAEMRAHHFLTALETTRAAGRDSAGLEQAAARALRDAGDRAASLHSYPAASRLYHRALELVADDDPDRPRLLVAAAAARPEAEGENLEELEAARDALLAVGDTDHAARAQIIIVENYWIGGGSGDETRRQLDRAAELAEQLPRSPSKAVVLAGISRFHMLGDRAEPALRFGEEALALAEELGIDEARANALNNLGTMKVGVGDRSGIADLERSIAIGEAHNSPIAVRSYNNLAFCLYRLGDLRESAEVAERMAALAERFGAGWVPWSSDRRLHAYYQAGRWDEAMALAEEMLESVAAGDGHYLEAAWREVRSRIRAARGDESGAEQDSALGLERARFVSDAQVLVPLLGLRLRRLAHSHPVEAAGLFAELDALTALESASLPHAWFPDVVEVAPVLGLVEAAEAMAARAPTSTAWTEAGLAQLRGDPLSAAERYGAMGARPDEAHARVRAAELLAGEGRRPEAQREARAALAFYREVGAVALARPVEAFVSCRSA